MNRASVSVFCALSLTVVGCGSPNSRPAPEFETLAVVTVIRPADGVSPSADRDTQQAAASKGTKRGAGAGVLASAACGPFWIVCVLPFAGLGAFVGISLGGLEGAMRDIAEGMTDEQAERTKIILAEIDHRRDFFVEMRDGVSETLPEHRQTHTGSADAIVYVGPTEILLVQDESSSLALRMKAILVAEWNRDKKTPRRQETPYVYETPKMPVEYWLRDNGKGFDDGFTDCVDTISKAMAYDLKLKIGARERT